MGNVCLAAGSELHVKTVGSGEGIRVFGSTRREGIG